MKRGKRRHIFEKTSNFFLHRRCGEFSNPVHNLQYRLLHSFYIFSQRMSSLSVGGGRNPSCCLDPPSWHLPKYFPTFLLRFSSSHLHLWNCDDLDLKHSRMSKVVQSICFFFNTVAQIGKQNCKQNGNNLEDSLKWGRSINCWPQRFVKVPPWCQHTKNAQSMRFFIEGI